MKITLLCISTFLLSNLGLTLAFEKLESKAPNGLMVEFLRRPANAVIADAMPEFSWVVHSSHQNDVQAAFRLLVSSDLHKLGRNQGDLWDSGKL